MTNSGVIIRLLHGKFSHSDVTVETEFVDKNNKTICVAQSDIEEIELVKSVDEDVFNYSEEYVISIKIPIDEIRGLLNVYN